MPELPDITDYIEALKPRLLGQPLAGIRRSSPFLLRSVAPPLAAFTDRPAVEILRLGKRIALGFEGDLWLVLHLMIAGRLHWKEAGAEIPGKRGLAAFDFPTGTLILTEAGSKRRASLHAEAGRAAMLAHHPGGLEVLETTLADFAAALRRENHTVKRALTDQRIFSGIGNAYSDEILHRARLSPVAMTAKLGDAEVERLFAGARETLNAWCDRLRRETGDGFPGKVTAFRPEMAVHGKFGQPCPVCGTEVQRIRHASNETNYCPRCQTEGRILADRSLSRLLKSDWPRNIEELEGRRKA
ncbi:MAG: zinc finger domain-containing protein [Kiloniellales bacterium]|nr:zinc finger domain-containing protein [Kiloniellales bacterium]